jgi:hypothetical protein
MFVYSEHEGLRGQITWKRASKIGNKMGSENENCVHGREATRDSQGHSIHARDFNNNNKKLTACYRGQRFPC